MLRFPTFSLFVVAALVPAGAFATTFTAGPNDDVEGLVNALQPGDELVLDDGVYLLDERFSFDLTGTEAMPIVIRADDGAIVHFQQNAGENIWDIRGSYVELRGLTFSGGAAGLRFESGDHFTVENCEIFGTSDVALRMNDGGQLYDGMRIIGNHIHDTDGTGEGMYLGCNNNGCQLANSLIANNYVHHTNASSVSQGDGIEIKEGSYNNVVRNNVIHDTKYPCILTYSTVGNGAPNLIEGNAMWNCGDNAIQSAEDAVIRNNIILGAGGNGIAMQPHQAGVPSNLEVIHNTVLNAGSAIAVRNADGPVLIANNAVYSQNGSAVQIVGAATTVTLAGNVGVGGAPSGFITGDRGADFVNAMLGASADVFPATGSALIGAGDTAYATMSDFNGTPRNGIADSGAYVFAGGGNPGWVLTGDFKGELEAAPGADMGAPGGDMGLTGDDMGASSPDMGSTGPTDLGVATDFGGSNNVTSNNTGNTATGDAGPGGIRSDEANEGCSCSTTERAPRAGSILLLIALMVRRRRTTERDR